ncbi:unnamed protein product [Brassica oleracea]
MSKQLTLSHEAKGVTVSPILEAEKPHNTSKHPQTQTPPTEVAASSDSMTTNKQKNEFDVFLPQLHFFVIFLRTFK